MHTFPSLQAIPFPECVVSHLEDLQRWPKVKPEDVEEMLESGFLPRGSTPAAPRREYLIYVFVNVLNDVIDSLNIIIADMDELPGLVHTLKGRPSKRVELLIRAFYGEFFRGREVTRKVLAELRRGGFLSRTVVRSITEQIDEHLGPAFSVRHSFAHGDAGLAGRSYNTLRALEELDIAELLVKRDGSPVVNFDGSPITLGDVAAPTCKEKSEGMRLHGELFRVAFSTVVDILVGAHGPVI